MLNLLSVVVLVQEGPFGILGLAGQRGLNAEHIWIAEEWKS